MAGKMVAATSTYVAALEKMVAKLENIFSQPKTIIRAIEKYVRTTQTYVKIDRFRNSNEINDIIIDADICRSDADKFQRDEDNGRSASDHLLGGLEDGPRGPEDLLVRDEHCLRNRNYCLGKEHHGRNVGDHSQGCTEDGVGRADHGLQAKNHGAPFIDKRHLSLFIFHGLFFTCRLFPGVFQ
jgi:hypothetical protein